MKKKYNLAFTPAVENEAVISLAKQFSHIADQYLLGEKSLPHVTLRKFYMEEHGVCALWKHIRSNWSVGQIDLLFSQFSCITFDESNFWISLLPNNRDVLHGMHVDAENILQERDILQEKVKHAFDPHMTLISSKNKEYTKEIALIATSYKPIKDTFLLSLGESDEVGQLLNIIYRW